MTATLPSDLQDVFERFMTTEFVTIDSHGQPIAWPLTPYYHHGEGCIDVTTGIGNPKKARDAQANPRVALLFSDPCGSGLTDPPTVLVQGTARVDDGDLDGLRERYRREMTAKLPGAAEHLPPRFLEGLAKWYFYRLYIHVRPERVFVWRGADAEPELLHAHMEEVRSGHNEEPEEGHAEPQGGGSIWDASIDSLGSRTYPTAVLAVVGPDGFPFAARVGVRPDQAARLVYLDSVPTGAPLEPGRACVTAHDHDERFTWQRDFQVRGDLVQTSEGWAIAPHKLVGGFELPPGSALSRMRINATKMRRFRRIAKNELARRGA